MDDILFFDATLRDGSHAIKHQLTSEGVEHYCKSVDSVGFHTVVIGHGNGMGASAIQSGISLHEDVILQLVAKPYLKKTKLGAFMLPGYGTIKDNIIPAINAGVDLFKIGTHCSEADIAKQHIEYARNAEKDVYGILMMTHMLAPTELLVQALKMQSYGAMGIILMDSAGTLLPSDVRARVQLLSTGLTIKVGFHAHNNLGMAVANTLVAIESGATIVDGTVRGFGAGAGNCQMEALLFILDRLGYHTGIDKIKLLDISENIVARELQTQPQEVTAYSMMSGYAGVVSTFIAPVKVIAKELNVSPMDIFMELGRRRIVAGQEDIIIEVAEQLAREKK
jgi:4-hydroxy 2-oxovalerate aldolase